MNSVRSASNGLRPVTHLTLFFLLFASCSKDPASTTNYAHFAEDQLSSSLAGRLAGKILGYETDYSNIEICVRNLNPNHEISDQELLFESKLAYAMWFEAAGYSADEWENRISFTTEDRCEDSQRYSGTIKLGSTDRTEDAHKVQNAFRAYTVICRKSGHQSFCGIEGGGIVLGVGGTGSLSYSYNPRDGKWISLLMGTPAHSFMSPYVNWISIKSDIEANAMIDEQIKSEISQAYDELLSKTSLTFYDFIHFGALLTRHKIVGDRDRIFEELFSAFHQSDDQTFKKSYIPRKGLFHVLLHEVGHQYGMAHADNPSSSDRSGPTEGLTKQRDDGFWVTDRATMAYGLDYFYLTEDDRAGVRASAAFAKEYLKEMKR